MARPTRSTSSGVPRRGEKRLDREGRAVVRARRVALALRLDPEAGGAVGEDDRRDPQSRRWEPSCPPRPGRLAPSRRWPAPGGRRTGRDAACRRRRRGSPSPRASSRRRRPSWGSSRAAAGRPQRGGGARRQDGQRRQHPAGSRADHDALPFARRPPERGRLERVERYHGEPAPDMDRLEGESAPAEVAMSGGVVMPRRFVLACPPSSVGVAGRGTRLRARSRARLGRPGRRHLPQPRPEGRLLRPRRDPRRRRLLPRRLGLPLRRHAGPPLARPRQLGGRRPGLPAARHAPEVRRDERLRPGHVGAHAAVPRRALLRLRLHAVRRPLHVARGGPARAVVGDGDGEGGQRLGGPRALLGRRRPRVPRPQRPRGGTPDPPRDEPGRPAPPRRRRRDLPRQGGRGPEALQAARRVLHLAPRGRGRDGRPDRAAREEPCVARGSAARCWWAAARTRAGSSTCRTARAGSSASSPPATSAASSTCCR